ncbi:phage antirepressor KilAC domain-containing protein [Agreia sp. COWG]|uniref:phage antirepressor KilAC domain-containing protein n=1 Tax=Agreia sp. COWG TaxID=2773266 RepID=UPI0019263567|nr:phage antirepressor KilAC domain-containing protein [Agreia sp. COWG]CAD5999467.1 ANT domain-containing protein [Agreia sp. COWG]
MADSRTRKTVQPYRWVSHRKEVCVVIDRGEIRFIARDVLEALEQPLPPFDKQPDRHQPYALRGEHCTSWTRAQVDTALSSIAFLPIVVEFIAWLDEVMRLIDSYQQPILTRSMIDPSAPRQVLAPAGVDAHPSNPAVSVPGSFSVADSAVILSRDPAIKLRTKDLHAHLLQAGWLRKPAGEYLPNDDLITIGYLAVVLRKVPAREQAYPQVCITPEGLQEIHKRLGGTAVIDLTIVDHTQELA